MRNMARSMSAREIEEVADGNGIGRHRQVDVDRWYCGGPAKESARKRVAADRRILNVNVATAAGDATAEIPLIYFHFDRPIRGAGLPKPEATLDVRAGIGPGADNLAQDREAAKAGVEDEDGGRG